MSEIAFKFLLTNFAVGFAIVVVAVIRKLARAVFGPTLAYRLWVLVPLSALASLAPSRVVEIIQPTPAVALPMLAGLTPPGLTIAPSASVTKSHDDVTIVAPRPNTVELRPNASSTASSNLWAIVAMVWLVGAVATLAWQLRNQSRFMADARAGLAGPAVAGFLRPRIVTPADFEDRFDPSEREVVLAHEAFHLHRNDARINAAVALARCICWFNPLVHVATFLMRIDQELACDAAVVARYPDAKAVYATALLKAELSVRPLPLGCYWPATKHPLMERVELLTVPMPGRFRRQMGAGVLTVLAVAASGVTWASIPAKERWVATPAPAESGSLAQAESEGAPVGAAPSPPPPMPQKVAAQPTDAVVSLVPVRFDPDSAPAPAPSQPEWPVVPTSPVTPASSDGLNVTVNVAPVADPNSDILIERSNVHVGPATGLASIDSATSAPGIAAPGNRCPIEPNPRAINPDIIECHAAFAPVPVVPPLLQQATSEERDAYGDWLIKQLARPDICGSGTVAGREACASLILVQPKTSRKVGVPLATAMPWVYVVSIYRISHPANLRATVIYTSDGIFGTASRPVWQLVTERRATQRCKDTIGGSSCARAMQQDVRYIPTLLLPRKDAFRVFNTKLVQAAYEEQRNFPTDADPKPYVYYGPSSVCPVGAHC